MATSGSSEDLPLVVASNVFSDVNRGGAAITQETLRAAQAVPARIAGITIGNQSPTVSHRHTIRRFPDADFVPMGTRSTGPLAGTRSVLQSLWYLIHPYSKSLPESLRLIQRASLVVSKGGHVYVERKGIRSLMSFWTTAFPIIYAHRIGIPTLTSPTSVGPFGGTASRLLNKFILSRFTAIATRDPLSTSAARSLVPSIPIHEFPDIVFGLEPATEEEVWRVCHRFSLEPNRFATLTVRSDSTSADSAELSRSLAAASKELLKDDSIDKVAVVVQAEDLAASRAVAEAIGRDALLISDDLSPADLVALYAGSRLTLASRLHSAIFSLVAGTKAIVVSIDGTKSEGVFQSLGLPPTWVVSFGSTEIAQLPEVATKVMADESWTHERLQANVGLARSRVSAYQDLVRSLASGNRASPDGISRAPLN